MLHGPFHDRGYAPLRRRRQLGFNVVKRWCEFNAVYFGGMLRPVPLVITNTQPFGKRLAFCSYNPNTSGRTITLNVPKQHN